MPFYTYWLGISKGPSRIWCNISPSHHTEYNTSALSFLSGAGQPPVEENIVTNN